MRATRGRRPKSERLLARLGVLRCATCEGPDGVGSTDQNGKRHYFYRCPPVGDCPRRVTISADLAEQAIEDEMRAWLEGGTRQRRASDELAAAERERRVGRAAARRRLIAMLTGLEDVDAAREQILAASEELEARQRAAELRAAAAPALTVSGGRDWDDLPSTSSALSSAASSPAPSSPPAAAATGSRSRRSASSRRAWRRGSAAPRAGRAVAGSRSWGRPVGRVGGRGNGVAADVGANVVGDGQRVRLDEDRSQRVGQCLGIDVVVGDRYVESARAVASDHLDPASVRGLPDRIAVEQRRGIGVAVDVDPYAVADFPSPSWRLLSCRWCCRKSSP